MQLLVCPSRTLSIWIRPWPTPCWWTLWWAVCRPTGPSWLPLSWLTLTRLSMKVGAHSCCASLFFSFIQICNWTSVILLFMLVMKLTLNLSHYYRFQCIIHILCHSSSLLYPLIHCVFVAAPRAHGGAWNYLRDTKTQDHPVAGHGWTSDCACAAIHTRYLGQLE